MDGVREYEPHPRLGASVRNYSTLAEFHTPHTAEHLILPDAELELTFYVGDGWTGGLGSTRGELIRLPPVFVRAPRCTPGRLVSHGMARVVGMRLHPWRASLLPELGPSVGGFHLEVGSELRDLSERVRPLIESDALESALEVIEAFLLRRQHQHRESLDEVDVVGLELDKTAGAARIGSLAAAQGLSVRQLERRFKSVTGFAPKAMARLMRFSRASERLFIEPGVSLTALAFELGYADQAHFTREFRAFAGMSPGKYAETVG